MLLSIQISYGIISILSVLGNTLVMLVFLNQRNRFNKSYNIMIFGLAVTDCMAGIVMFISPKFVFDPPLFEPTNIPGLIAYCHMLWIRMIVFLLGFASTYICLLLAFDRWVAVVRPTRYKQVFTVRKTIVGVFLSYVIALGLVWIAHPGSKYAPGNPAGKRCIILRAEQDFLAHVRGVLGFLLKSALPFFVITCLYAHLVYKLRKSPNLGSEQHSAITRRVTRVAALATTLLIISWSPSQVSFFLSSIGYGNIRSALHLGLSVLAMLNFCLNPIIYALASKEFRKGYWEVFTKCRCLMGRRHRVAAREERAGTERSDVGFAEDDGGGLGDRRAAYEDNNV
ncbi:predicted protein [Nematostella vectensis]|uniref:G-protein coupled receptors family 1 profile domain-containing protein n=1 Tax=Nematostella vectensis TaxID=45351 RepID=A7RJJ3_NEMVE|nr:allatostatin-A receptor [Nematostella vectensis]EDO48387.1 predicted protein [Nematostella vectensis]|eukprot:XP_001640450.1 predicted protein [Nematostella vectensis]